MISTVIFLNVVLFSACSENIDIYDSNESLSTRAIDDSHKPKVFSISYEMDITSISQFDCTPTIYDKAAGAPFSDKQRIEMILSTNGDVELITEKLPSKNQINVNHESPPSDLPEITKTVMKDNKMDLYDSANNLIRSIPDQKINIRFEANEILEALNSMDDQGISLSSFIACMRSGLQVDSLTKLIERPTEEVTVNLVGENIYSIRMELPVEIATDNAEYIVSLIDNQNKLLLASRLYDKKGEVSQCMMYQYDDCELKGFRQEVKQELPNCKNATLLTFAEISNLSFTNLK